MESWGGGDVVVIRSPSPQRGARRTSPDEDRRERVRPLASRVGGAPASFRGGSPARRHIDDSEGKGTGKSKERTSRADGGAFAGQASLEPAWQVHARRRKRVARAILEAAAARGAAHSDDEQSDEDSGAEAGRAEPFRQWSWPPSSKGKGRGKGPPQKGGSGYQVSATRVHVSNLPKDVTEGNLEHLFKQHGNVLGLQLLTSGARGQICAIIRFSSNADAERSIAALHNKHEVRPGDGPILVKLAKPNPRWDNN